MSATILDHYTIKSVETRLLKRVEQLLYALLGAGGHDLNGGL